MGHHLWLRESPMLVNEQHTIDLAKEGDHDAFARLMSTYQDRLFTSLANSIGCETEAEDVVQETFVNAYLKLSGFRGTSSFYTWIYRIARNVAATRQQRLKSTRSLDVALRTMGQEPVDCTPQAVNALENAEQANDLATALQRISDDYRTVLVLREIDGFDYATIASLLGIRVGTVRSRLHRARLELGRAWRQLKGNE